MFEDILDVIEYAISWKEVPTVREGSSDREIDKVIFQDSSVVVVAKSGKRYVAKPEKGEKYDREKGLLVCLAKMNGYTTTKVQHLLASGLEKKSEKVVARKGDGRKK